MSVNLGPLNKKQLIEWEAEQERKEIQRQIDRVNRQIEFVNFLKKWVAPVVVAVAVYFLIL